MEVHTFNYFHTQVAGTMVDAPFRFLFSRSSTRVQLHPITTDADVSRFMGLFRISTFYCKFSDDASYVPRKYNTDLYILSGRRRSGRDCFAVFAGRTINCYWPVFNKTNIRSKLIVDSITNEIYIFTVLRNLSSKIRVLVSINS